MSFQLIATLLVTGVIALPESASQPGDLLAPGPFRPWSRVEVGPASTFSNDIYSIECFPLHTAGRVMLWAYRAHQTADRVFVETCDEILDRSAADPGTVPGTTSGWWFEATLEDPTIHPIVRLRRLAFPGWGYFANPEPCGGHVAYWSYPSSGTAGVRGVVGSLLTGRVVAQKIVGSITLETDNPGALETPAWAEGCGSVTFSGKRYGLADIRLTVGQSPVTR